MNRAGKRVVAANMAILIYSVLMLIGEQTGRWVLLILLGLWSLNGLLVWDYLFRQGRGG